MNRMNLGAGFVSVWSGLNLVLAAGILVAMLALGQHPPSLSMYCTPEDLRAAPDRVVAVAHALALLFNAAAVALCGAVSWLVWARVRAGDRGVGVVLAFATGLVQVFGFVSDGALGSANLGANVAWSVVLATGWALMLWRAPAP